MTAQSLDALVTQHLELAAGQHSGRSAETVYGGHEHMLRQTLIALLAGQMLEEHESPGNATVHVLKGDVRLIAASAEWEGTSGDLLAVPDARHSLLALTDSVVLLTVAKAL